MANGSVKVTFSTNDAREWVDALHDGLYVGAYLYPQDQAYRQGRHHFQPGEVKDVDLAISIYPNENTCLHYELSADLAEHGVILSGVYKNLHTSSLHAVLFNPVAPNVYLDNGTCIVVVTFSKREQIDVTM